MPDIKGIIPALLSPSDAEGNLDLTAVPPLIEFLLDRHVNGLFVGGSTGEGFFLTAAERVRLLELVVKQVRGSVPVIAHVASMNFREALEMAAHARDAKADAVSSVVPFYYPFTAQEICAYYGEIARVSGLPIIVYALSAVSRPTLTPQEFMTGLGSIGQLYGVKFSDSDFFKLQQFRQLAPESCRFYGGWDSLALPMFVMGACGLIGSNYNALPEIWLAIYDSFRRGDLACAQARQERLTYYMKQMGTVPPLARAKTLLKLRGIDVGSPRWPMSPPRAEHEELLGNVLAELKADRLFPGIA